MRYILTLILLQITCFSFDQTGYTEHIKLMYRHESTRKSQMLEFDLHNFIQQNQDLKQLPKTKKVKKLTSAVEKHFFRTYSEFSNFSEIDASGIYTPITSTILMAIVYEAFEIPYAIRVSTVKVELIAYPKTSPISWDCENKTSNIYYWTDFSISMVLNHIIRSEVISESSVRQKGGQEYINEIFQEREDIELNQLIGIYYFNKSMETVERGRKEKALFWVNLAIELHNNEHYYHLKAAIFNDLLVEAEKTDLKIPEYLTGLYALTPDTKTKETILSSFEYYFKEALVDREDTVFVNLCDEWIQKNLAKHADYNLFLSFTKFIKGYKLTINGRDTESLVLLKEAIQLNPENHHYQDLLGSHIVRVAILDKTNDNELMDSIKVYQKSYPFLAENSDYTDFIYPLLYDIADDSFLMNDPTNGYKIIGILEAFPNYEMVSESEQIIRHKAFTYSEIATYYYRQKNFSEALSWAEKAEILDPEDALIRSRADTIRKKIY